MEKEYFFCLRLKNGATITVWDLVTDAEAQKRCLALHNHYDALMSSYRTPSDFKCFAAFLNCMRMDGFNGFYELSPI